MTVIALQLQHLGAVVNKLKSIEAFLRAAAQRAQTPHWAGLPLALCAVLVPVHTAHAQLESAAGEEAAEQASNTDATVAAESTEVAESAAPSAAEAEPTEVAQAPESEVASSGAADGIEEITIIGRGQTRAANTIVPSQIEMAAPGVAPQALLTTVPGVNVQMSDPFGMYEFGSSVRVRGFTTEQLALTLDGVPLEETPDTRDSTPPNRYIDTENLSTISVAQGSGDVTAPSFHALGGSLRYMTSDPSGAWGAKLTATGGKIDKMNRIFARLDTPALWAGGPIAFVSASRASAVQWQNPFASMRTEHIQAKLKQELSFGSLTLMYLYGNRDDHDISAYNKDGSDNFPLARNLTGDPAIDALFYDNWLNGRTDELLSLRGEFDLAESLKLTVQPYYEHKQGYGVGGVGPSAARSLYCSATFETSSDDYCDNDASNDISRAEITRPLDGRITKRLEDMGGDRIGTTLDLTYTIGSNQLQLGGWYQDYDFYQKRPLYNLTDGGDFDPSSVIFVYYDRQISTKVTQFYLKDKLSLGERLVIEFGSKSLIVDRKAQGYLAGNTDFAEDIDRDRKKKDEDYFQPQVGFVFDVSDAEQIFANYAENFSATPRLAFMAASFNDSLQPERSTNIDAGIRTQRGSFGGSFTLYHIDYKDRVLNLANPDPERLGEDTYQNVGAIETYGAEIGAYWSPTTALRIGSALSLNSSEFQDDYAKAGGDGTVIVPVEGKKVPDTPSTMLALDASYKLGNFTFMVDGKYTGKRYSSTINDESLKAYTIANGSVSFKGSGDLLGGLSITGHVYNIFDKEYFSYIAVGESAAAGDVSYNYAAPRMFYLTVGVDL